MITEDYVDVNGGLMYYRAIGLKSGKPAVLMIHGLGESGLCFNDDTFISSEAFKADRCGDFERWLRQDFMEETVFKKWAAERGSAQRYYASLHFCKPQAFLKHAQDAVMMNLPRAGKIGSLMGERYFDLKEIAKIYCWGERSIPQETLYFIDREEIENKKFSEAGHWLMVDKADEFYSFLAQFAEGLKS